MKTNISIDKPAPRPDHLKVFAPDLCDIRNRKIVTVRKNFEYHHVKIDTVAQLKATLRAGKYAWPGGYPLFFIASDGAALSFESVLEEFRNVVDSIKNNIDDGWQIIGCMPNWDENDLVCDHSGKTIECAYS